MLEGFYDSEDPVMNVEKSIFITSLKLSKVHDYLVYFCTDHMIWSRKCIHFLCAVVLNRGRFGG